jgi:hypothetical protein
MPLAKNTHLVRETAGLEKTVEAARERITVHVEQVLVVPSILAVDALDDFEELFLRVAVAGVALADVTKLDVDEVVQGSAVDVPDSVSRVG